MEDVKARLDKLEEWKIETNTRLAIAETDIKTMKEDLTDIKNNTTWTFRLIVGAIITGVISGGIALVFAALSGGGS